MFNTSKKVLVVDDMLTMRKIVVKFLKELGFIDIEEAANGSEAWQKIEHGNYNLIISDWNMPQCTGLDLLKRVRGSSKYSKVPFILVTAEAEKDQISEAIKSGVDQYVIKPFSKDSLQDKLELASKKCSIRGQF